MAEHFNFRAEIINKYDEDVFDLIMESFDHLPLAALVDNKILAVHGGISPKLIKIQTIKQLDRHREVPKSGLVT